MRRHTFLGFLMLSLLIGGALAADLPSEGQIVVVSADGVVAGTGVLESGDLELELLAGFTGFGTMTVIGEAGEVFVYGVMVQAGGEVVLTESLDGLATLVRSAGGTVDVSLHEGGTAAGGEATGAAGADEVGVDEGAKADEPAATVPERADDVKDTAEDHGGRTLDEVGGTDAIDGLGGEAVGAVDETTGAGDAVDGLGGEGGASGDPAGAGSETEAEPGEPADEADRPGEDDRRDEDALPTPEVPRLP